MRYVIGCRIYSNEAKKIIEGVYGYGSSGLPVLLINASKSIYAPVFTDCLSANHFLNWLQKGYSKEFKKNKKYNKNLSNNDERFYLLKLDSSNSKVSADTKKLYKKIKFKNYPFEISLYETKSRIPKSNIES